MKAKWTSMLAAAIVSLSPGAGAADCRVTSPDHTVALIELYTSEGCDSCPPADRWFSGLDLGQDGSRAVALAFHVDYWDRLGWRDRFGSAAFTARQHEQMQRRRAAFVYTPQVLLQGTDFGAWREAGQPAAAIAAINARPARAAIELSAASADGRTAAVDLHVRIPQQRDRAHAVAAVALVQSGLGSDVKAGENAGKHLAHNHVVRSWRADLPIDASGELRRHVELPLPADRGDVQVVAFAEDGANGDVLQALALPLCAR